ncbi:MAG: GreA/GreB family elongation factor [Chlamydiales bacterium]|nr:GreA/GreB family elongation factor [Chlamydiales bacterium]
MEYLKQIQEHISNQRLPSIVSLWEEYCMGDEIDIEELKQILKAIKESTLGDSFGCYVEHVLPLWESLPESNAKHEIFKTVVDMQTTNDASLRQKVMDYLQDRYGTHHYFHQKIRLIGLKDHPSFRYAISNFELLTHMEAGNFVFHTAGWGVGEIMEVSLTREQISLEFDYVAGRKDLSFANAFHTLLPLPKDHFLSRRFGAPDSLEEKAKQDPVFVIRILLRDLGPKAASEIKDELCGLVIAEEDWSKWWQQARTKLKKDTMIEVPTNIKDLFKLREAEVSHEERLQQALKKKPSVTTMIEMVYSFLRDFPSSLKNEEFVNNLKEELTQILLQHELTTSQELEVRFFLQDLSPNDENFSDNELIKKLTNIETIINSLDIIAFKKRALVLVRKLRSDWESIFLNLLSSIDHNPIRDYILIELLKSKKEKELTLRLQEITSSPQQYPHAVLWYLQKVLHDKEEAIPLSDHEGRNYLLEIFFTLMHRIESDEKYRELIKKMHLMLINGRYSMIRHIFQHANKDIVKEFLLLASKCLSLTDHDKKILQSLAEVAHPSLIVSNKNHDEDESIIWTTDEGFFKVKERIHQIATVETVDNAREIEVARSHGDLRENSEYKFALERRQRLQSELKFLSDQVSQARVLTKDDINTDIVGVGNVIVFKNPQGKTTTYTLLGPWDADVEQNILSFQSKIAQSLKGRKIGDHCIIGSEEWTITDIKSYLD